MGRIYAPYFSYFTILSIFYLTKENICRIGRSSKFLP
nr:MAG TPA: hypothetical protein [Siphoviridae sp. ctFjF5]DAU57441.1 MAG TPA: hypothetical protein [Caudoviricetes sp.]